MVSLLPQVLFPGRLRLSDDGDVLRGRPDGAPLDEGARWVAKRDQKGAHEQERRRLWRALLLNIKAKLEAVESGISVFDEEFMAHIVLPKRLVELGTLPSCPTQRREAFEAREHRAPCEAR